ncbi:MAG: hypothetical protein KatS3mg054_0099 [Chloroflexus sp.]|nr:MAG: hypothetical protein KatS3mg054_0099 [Chloroflexus sp.]
MIHLVLSIVTAIVMLLSTSAYSAEVMEIVNGSNGVPIGGNINDIAVDSNGRLAVISSFSPFMSASGRGAIAVWRVAGNSATRLYSAQSPTQNTGCYGRLARNSDNIIAVYLCGLSGQVLADIDTGTEVRLDTNISDTITHVMYRDGFVDVFGYARIYHVQPDTGAVSRGPGTGMFTCESDSARIPLVSSSAVFFGDVLMAERVCYGLGSIFKLSGSGSERITGWPSKQHLEIGDRISDARMASPLIDSIGAHLVLVSANRAYVLDDTLRVIDIVGDFPSSASILRIAVSGNMLYGLTLSGSVLGIPYSFIQASPTPTETSTSTPAPHTATPTAQAQPSPTETQATSEPTPTEVPTTAEQPTPSPTQPSPTNICTDLLDLVQRHCR